MTGNNKITLAEFNAQFKRDLNEVKLLEKSFPTKATEKWMQIVKFIVIFAKSDQCPSKFKSKMGSQAEAILQKVKLMQKGTLSTVLADSHFKKKDASDEKMLEHLNNLPEIPMAFPEVEEVEEDAIPIEKDEDVEDKAILDDDTQKVNFEIDMLDKLTEIRPQDYNAEFKEEFNDDGLKTIDTTVDNFEGQLADTKGNVDPFSNTETDENVQSKEDLSNCFACGASLPADQTVCSQCGADNST